MNYENLLQNQLLNSRSIPTGIITIPVVVHVVYNTSAQNITDARINEQIRVLNEDYRRLNADRVNTPSAFASVAGDAQFEFKLAKIDPNGNATTGITRTSTTVTGFSQSSNNVKQTSTGGHDPWNTQLYLNIWVCNFSDPDLMGYGTFPADFATSPNLDGVVISFNYFGKTGTSAPYNKGRTTTHEVGHWLDLRHIWGDNSSCSVDDGVADTPVQSVRTPTTHPNCPSFPRTDACTTTSPGVMFMNYMDYTDDGCMNLFTNGQIARMRALFDDQIGTRRQIIQNASFLTNLPPTAISGPTLVCSSPTTYTVANAIAGFTWSVGGTNLQIVSTGNNSVTVQPITSPSYVQGSLGWVSVYQNGVELAKKDVWVGFPNAYIVGPEFAGYTETYISAHDPLSNASISWSVENGDYSMYTSDIYAYITFNNTAYYKITLSTWNSCGPCTVEKYVYANWGRSPSPFTVHPNPVNDVLYIDVDQQAIQSKFAAAGRTVTNPVYEFRLYNVLGLLVRQTTATGNNAQIYVSNLPKGTYVLHIYDGVSVVPEIIQIMKN